MRAFAVHAGHPLPDHAALEAYCVAHWREFWAFFLQGCREPLGIEGDVAPVCVGNACERAVFFPALALNYADALLNLEVADAAAPALIACHGDGSVQRWTRGELRERVTRL